jgi:hypothetical protein
LKNERLHEGQERRKEMLSVFFGRFVLQEEIKTSALSFGGLKDMQLRQSSNEVI